MNKMEQRHFLPLSLLCFLLIIQLTTNPARAWLLIEESLVAVPYPVEAQILNPPVSADLDNDGIPETLAMAGRSLTILAGGQSLWQSPAGWNVIQTDFTDLNRDDTPDVTLLVWRPYKPWPVDEFLPYGGRIAAHQDEDGNSCHLILVGWIGDKVGEIWAGSALVNPITTFRATDLDGDSLQELITLEGEYSHTRSSPAGLLNVWEWNGFGFTIVLSQEGFFSDLAIAQEKNNQLLVLTP